VTDIRTGPATRVDGTARVSCVVSRVFGEAEPHGQSLIPESRSDCAALPICLTSLILSADRRRSVTVLASASSRKRATRAPSRSAVAAICDADIAICWTRTAKITRNRATRPFREGYC